jgi:hypothetical protein
LRSRHALTRRQDALLLELHPKQSIGRDALAPQTLKPPTPSAACVEQRLLALQRLRRQLHKRTQYFLAHADVAHVLGAPRTTLARIAQIAGVHALDPVKLLLAVSHLLSR